MKNIAYTAMSMFAVLLLIGGWKQYISSGYTQNSSSPIALVSHTTFAAATSATSSAISTTGATLLTIALSNFNASACTATVTSVPSNTWICLNNYSNSYQDGAIWYAASPTVSSSQTFSVTGSFFAATVAAWSSAAASPVDVQNGGGSATGTSQSTGTVTPNFNNELCVAGGYNADATASSVAFSAPFTLLDYVPNVNGANLGGADSYSIQTTATLTSTTFSENGSGGNPIVASVVCFKHA